MHVRVGHAVVGVGSRRRKDIGVTSVSSEQGAFWSHSGHVANHAVVGRVHIGPGYFCAGFDRNGGWHEREILQADGIGGCR